MNFAYFGRLAVEKGFDQIISSWLELQKKSDLKAGLLVFGNGLLVEKFLNSGLGIVDWSTKSDADLLNASVEAGEIYYAGQRNFKEVIKPMLQKHIDYTLMPSRYIETFGLSALESLGAGVPVIGFRHGGLKNFVSEDLEIKSSLLEKIEELFENSHKPDVLPIANLDLFSSASWLKKFKQLIPAEAKRILLLNDFVGQIGGAEIFVDRVVNLLKTNGYDVELHSGCEVSEKPSWQSMLKAVFNLSAYFKLRKKLKKFKPDVVWCHSLMRGFGPLPLAALDGSTFNILTHHDAGLLIPYPSLLTSESDLLNGQSNLSFTKKIGGFLKSVLLVRRLKKRFAKFDLQLVPSEFLLEPVERFLPNVVAEVLPHFVD